MRSGRRTGRTGIVSWTAACIAIVACARGGGTPGPHLVVPAPAGAAAQRFLDNAPALSGYLSDEVGGATWTECRTGLPWCEHPVVVDTGQRGRTWFSIYEVSDRMDGWVTLSSNDFDPTLTLVRRDSATGVIDGDSTRTDDDQAGACDARLPLFRRDAYRYYAIVSAVRTAIGLFEIHVTPDTLPSSTGPCVPAQFSSDHSRFHRFSRPYDVPLSFRPGLAVLTPASEPARGFLSPADPQLGNGAVAHHWVVAGAAGQMVRLSMHPNGFTARLFAYSQNRRAGAVSIGCPAALDVRLYDDTVTVIASASEAGGFGPYTLAVTDPLSVDGDGGFGQGSAACGTEAGPVHVADLTEQSTFQSDVEFVSEKPRRTGNTATSWTARDRLANNVVSRVVETWAIRGPPNQRVVLDVTTAGFPPTFDPHLSTFDPYMFVSTWTTAGEEPEVDDDSGVGCSSRRAVMIPENGWLRVDIVAGHQLLQAGPRLRWAQGQLYGGYRLRAEVLDRTTPVPTTGSELEDCARVNRAFSVPPRPTDINELMTTGDTVLIDLLPGQDTTSVLLEVRQGAAYPLNTVVYGDVWNDRGTDRVSATLRGPGVYSLGSYEWGPGPHAGYSVIADGTCHAVIPFRPKAGVYVLDFVGRGRGRVSLTLRSEPGAHPPCDPSPTGARTLAANAVLVDTLRAGESFWEVPIRPEADGDITIDVSSDAFDPTVLVMDVDTNYGDDDGGRWCNARVSLRVRADRTYPVRVSSAVGTEGGVFHLVLTEGRSAAVVGDCLPKPDYDRVGLGLRDEASAPAVAVIAADGTRREVRGALTAADAHLIDGAHVRYYDLDVTTPNLYVGVESDVFDARAWVWGQNRAFVVDDDGWGGCNALIGLRGVTPGRYRLAVSSFYANEIGSFRVVVSPTVLPTQREACVYGTSSEIFALPVTNIDTLVPGDTRQFAIDEKHPRLPSTQSLVLVTPVRVDTSVIISASPAEAAPYLIVGREETGFLRESPLPRGCDRVGMMLEAPAPGIYHVVVTVPRPASITVTVAAVDPREVNESCVRR